MNSHKSKILRKRTKVRSKMVGTNEKPRLSVHRSTKHIYVQAIDDVNAHTLASSSDQKLKGSKSEKASMVGKKIAETLLSQSIKSAIFDRGSFIYKGRVKALAEAIRANGISI